MSATPSCPNCGAPASPGARFCANCGTSLAPPSAEERKLATILFLDVNAGAMILARTPDWIRGRASGAFRFVNYGIRPIGALMGGLLGGLIGVRPTLFVVTIAALGGVLWLIRTPLLQTRELPGPPD